MVDQQTVKKVILRNHQLLGDSLMCTPLVRDLKKQFPHWKVKPQTAFQHIWDNNPYVDKFDGGTIYNVGPKIITQSSKTNGLHFTNGFRMSLEVQLDIPIKQGLLKPELYLSEYEKNKKIIEGHYWVINIDCGPYAAKRWADDRWQEVINRLPWITFVQVGLAKDNIYKLKGDNVIDYIGKTDDLNVGLRDLFILVYHSQGCLSLVSSLMHIAAAFEKPCVVGDTLISTKYGLQFPTNLIRKNFKAMNDGKLYNSKGFWETGTKKVIQLDFKSGRQLCVTESHEIMIDSGWKKAKDIKIGEKVRIHNHRKYNFNISSRSIYYEERKDYARGYCLGNLLSDGYVSRKSAVMVWYGKDRMKYYNDGLTLMEEAGWGISKRYRAKDNGIDARISSINLYDFAVEKKCIVYGKKVFSKDILIGSWYYIAGLVAGYFDGDGTVGDYKNRMSVSISSVKLNNIKLLQIALSSLGIDSKIYTEKKARLNTFAKRKYNSNLLNKIIISGDNIGIFVSNVPIRNVDKLNKIRKIEFKRRKKPKVTKFFDTLVNVSEVGEKKVYDCKVEGIHSFDANSIYVHNCVIPAGAREPITFEGYQWHKYIHKTGCLPCSKITACWACSRSGCFKKWFIPQSDEIKRKELGDEAYNLYSSKDKKERKKFNLSKWADENKKNWQPKCMDMISVDEVKDAVLSYYDGGILKKPEVKAKMNHRKIFRVVSNGKMLGGAEHSVIEIIKMAQERNYDVELATRRGILCSAISNKLSNVKLTNKISSPCDILLLYASDMIWDFHKEEFDIFNKLQAKRKVMALTYHIGQAGKAEWTKDWNLYLFLSSTMEKEFIDKVEKQAEKYFKEKFQSNTYSWVKPKTRVLAPPIDLTDLFKIEPDYNGPLHILRHSSQGDIKYSKDINDLIEKSNAKFSFMPAPSFLNSSNKVIKYGYNQLSIKDFLSKGNCYAYWLPEKYTDQGPRAVMEAMATGLPIIAENRDGAKDRVTNECGWLINSHEESINIINSLTPEILKEKGIAARERAKKEFRKESWVEAIIG